MNKNSLPKYANHYYDPDVGPFPCLSELSDFECNRAIHESNAKFTRGERKWYFDESYMPTRKRLEFKMREIFVNKGGRAPRSTPYYFWWGGDGYREMMGVDHFKKVSIKISALPPDVISFTYPDSFGSMAFAEDPVYAKHYHGKVFTYDEIHKLFEKEQFPYGGWEGNDKFRVLKYVEIQLWSDEPVKEYLSKR